jgi:hypothetical protein
MLGIWRLLAGTVLKSLVLDRMLGEHSGITQTCRGLKGRKTYGLAAQQSSKGEAEVVCGSVLADGAYFFRIAYGRIKS